MIKYKKDNISSLSELFQVWMGGSPENDQEIRNFLKSSKLEKIIGVNDVDAILRDVAYFPDVVLPAVYVAIPLKLKLHQQERVVSSQELYRLNYMAERQPMSSCLSISFGAATELQNTCFILKKQQVSVLQEQKRQRLRDEKMKLKQKEIEKKKAEALKKKKEAAEMAALEKEIKQEEKLALAKKRAQEKEYEKVMRKINSKVRIISEQKKKELEQKRAEEQEFEKTVLRPRRIRNLQAQRKRLKGKKELLKLLQAEQSSLENLGEHANQEQREYKDKLGIQIETLFQKIAIKETELMKLFSTERNKVYREKNRLEIKERINSRRLALKEQDAEALKLKDKKDNAKADRKRHCRTYYERHKEEISLKTNGNPKAAFYKKQYKIKKRFETKTGPVVMALLNGIINSKAKN